MSGARRAAITAFISICLASSLAAPATWAAEADRSASNTLKSGNVSKQSVKGSRVSPSRGSAKRAAVKRAAANRAAAKRRAAQRGSTVDNGKLANRKPVAAKNNKPVRVRKPNVVIAKPAVGIQKPKQGLKEIERRKNDEQHIGAIGSVNLPGGQKVTLERRNVLTRRGLKPLVLNRIGNQYVYDGDIVVPPTAIEGIGFQNLGKSPRRVTFAAGIPGAFGEGTLWEDATIPYETVDGFCCEANLRRAIEDYEARTIFRFVERDGHPDFIKFVNEYVFSSRTMQGKNPGENTIWIRPNASVGTIQHEIGHRLGLIHEHLRADRDQHIARNPNCTPGDIFQAVYEGWIDVTNVAFTNDAAELLTDYDFESIMHYGFGLDLDGDRFADCNTWVRLESCTDRDPAAADCSGSFSGTTLSEKDIEGLHMLYAAVPGANEFPLELDQVRQFTGQNVRHRGKRIDKCMHGLPFGVNSCDVVARDRVADAFCETQGYTDGFNIRYERLSGTHSGFHDTQGWIDLSGEEVISSIVCQDLTLSAELVSQGTLEEETFRNSDAFLNGRPVDRCMWGDNISGDRCSEANQRRVADAFCVASEYQEASVFETAWGPNPFMTGFHGDSDEFRDVAGIDYFKSIRCVR